MYLWSIAFVVCVIDVERKVFFIEAGKKENLTFTNVQRQTQQIGYPAQLQDLYSDYPVNLQLPSTGFSRPFGRNDFSIRLAVDGRNTHIGALEVMSRRLKHTRKFINTKYANGIQLVTAVYDSLKPNESCTYPQAPRGVPTNTQLTNYDWLKKLDVELKKAKTVLEGKSCNSNRQKREARGSYKNRCSTAMNTLKKLRKQMDQKTISGLIMVHCNIDPKGGYNRRKKRATVKENVIDENWKNDNRSELYRIKRDVNQRQPRPRSGLDDESTNADSSLVPASPEQPDSNDSPVIIERATYPQGFITDPDGMKIVEDVGPQPGDKPNSCTDLVLLGNITSGVYSLHEKRKDPTLTVQAYCDMEADDGGWTVILRRDSKYENRLTFNRSWEEYIQGFGDPNEEYWIGLDYLSKVTASRDKMIYISMEDQNGAVKKAIYKHFVIGPEPTDFELQIGRFYGSAGDSLSPHHRKKFTTWDRDNDEDPYYNCARTYNFGWWYHSCFHANLFGFIGDSVGEKVNAGKRIVWKTFNGFFNPIKKAEVKMRHRCY